MPGIFDCQPAKCLTRDLGIGRYLSILSVSVRQRRNVSAGVDRKERALGVEPEWVCWKKKQRAATQAARVPIALQGLPRLALLLFFRRWRRRGRRRLGRRCCRRVRSAGHALLKTADAFAETFHDFRDTLSAKENKDNRQNDHPMENDELTHELPPRALRRANSNPSAVFRMRQDCPVGSTVAPIG